MTRWACWLVLLVAACDSNHDSPLGVDVDFPGMGSSGYIPFKAGGPFEVRVSASASELGPTSRALVQLVSAESQAGTVTSAMISLVDQGNGSLEGRAMLSWPPGGPIKTRVQVADFERDEPAPLEPVVLGLSNHDFTTTGAQILLPVCVDSTSSDGNVTLRLNGATISGTGAVEATAALLPGHCNGASDGTSSESSYASFTVVATGSKLRLSASMPNTTAITTSERDLPSFGTLTLALTPQPETPAPLSIVELTVDAKLDGVAAPGIVVSFQAVPAITIFPSMVTTDSQGRARAHFQRPEFGQLRVEAHSGSASDAFTFQ